jgi:hypothetical protein
MVCGDGVENMRKIPITGGLEVIVDDEEYHRITLDYSWSKHYTKYTYYARAKVRGATPKKWVYMHRVIMDCPNDMEVDHINGNGLDNRKENLRICTSTGNNRNISKRHLINGTPATSQFKGVCWHERRNKWWARGWVNGNSNDLGHFPIEADAARAYNNFALEHFGVFAKLNILPQENM